MKNFQIFPIGSCRVNDPLRKKQQLELPKMIFTHSTKEALQMVKVLMGKRSAPNFYEYKVDTSGAKSQVSSTDCFLIEVCTRKVFYFGSENDRVYCNNAKADELRLEGVEVFSYEQDIAEIHRDLAEIRALLFSKLIAVTGHIVPLLDTLKASSAERLWEARNSLRNTLQFVCTQLPGVKFVDVSSILEQVSADEVFASKSDGPDGLDMNHYNPGSFIKIADFFENMLRPKVLIATPGKVGTVALVQLFKPYYNTSVLPSHNLNFLKDAIFKRSKLEVECTSPLKVITGIRHPLDFVISAFCQVIKAGRLQNLSYTDKDDYLKVFEDEGEKIIKNYFSWLSKFIYLSQCNINIEEFGASIRKNGYYKAKLNSFEVNFFIYRFEDLISKEGPLSALKAWGGLASDEVLARENVAPKEGVIGEVYSNLKSNIGNYKSIVESVKSSSVYQIFYTDSEIEANLSKYKVKA